MENTVVNDEIMATETVTTPEGYADDDDFDVVEVASDGSISQVTGDMVEESDTEVQGETAAAAADTQKEQKYYKSQQEVDAAFGARLNAERKKYQNDINLSGKIRTMFGGMTDEQISEMLIDYSAQKYAEEKNIPIEVSKEFASLKMNLPSVSKEVFPMESNENKFSEQSERIAMLANQAESIEKKYNVNMAEILSKSPELAQKVFSEGMDMNDAYIQHIMTSQSSPKPKPITPVKTANSTSDIDVVKNMTEKQKERIREQLMAGNIVKF